MKYRLLFIHLLLFNIFQINTISSQNGLSFDGVDDYVQTTFSGMSGATTPITIEAWIRTAADALPSANGQQVITDFGSFVTGGRFTFNVLWANAIRLEVGGNGLSGTIPVNDSMWHHVAVVYNPSITNKLSLYVDGILDVSGNVTVPIALGSTTNFRIGQRIDGINSFTGDIDEVRFWNIALDTAQLIASMNNEFCNPPAGLLAYYPLNEGIPNGTNTTITTTADKSGNNNGTLNGFALSGATSNWINGAPVTSGVTSSSITVSDCQSYTSPSGNTIYTATGTYFDTIPNSKNCDSIITINLTLVNNPTFANITVVECDSYTSPSGNFTFTSSGSYLDTIPNSQNCDSVIAIALTINTVNSGIALTGNGSTASATEVGARYQWLDCNNGFAMLINDTNRTFTPSMNGSYAVKVTKNGCTDTSSCLTFTSVGLQQSSIENELIISPNPTNGHILINFGTARGLKNYTIRNMVGQIITQGSTSSEQVNYVITADKGLYFIEVEMTNGKKTIRKIVKH